MSKTAADRASEYLDESTRRASKYAATAGDAIEDGLDAAREGLDAARQAAKDGREAIEEFAEDAAKHVKRYPLQSVLISLAAGVVLGLLIGWTTKSE